MNSTQERLDEAPAETQQQHGGSHILRAISGSQPAQFPQNSPDRPTAPRHRFPVGNRFGGKRKPVDVLTEMDRTLKDALTRLQVRNYELEIDATGQQVRVERPLDAARGNAIANLARARLELFEMREAVSEVRRLQVEVEKLKAITVSLLER